MSTAHSNSTPLSHAFVHAMVAVLVFSVWLTVSPYVIPEAVPTTSHLLFGLVLSALAVLFLYFGLSQPVHELGSVWQLSLLAILVLVGALSNLPRGNLLFWSDVLVSGAILGLTLYALYLTSRFTEGEEHPSSLEGSNGN